MDLVNTKHLNQNVMSARISQFPDARSSNVIVEISDLITGFVYKDSYRTYCYHSWVLKKAHGIFATLSLHTRYINIVVQHGASSYRPKLI